MRCVYIIKCLFTKMCYIGSTEIYQVRIEEHIKLLEEGTHYNKRMQKDYNIHKQYFVYGVVREFGIFVSRDEIYDFEQELIDSVPNKYNINLNAKEHLNRKDVRKETQRQMKINFLNIK